MKELIEALIAIVLATFGAILMSKEPTAGAILTATSCWLLFKD